MNVLEVETKTNPQAAFFEGRAQVVSRLLQMKREFELQLDDSKTLRVATEAPIGAGKLSIVYPIDLEGKRAVAKVYHPSYDFLNRFTDPLKPKSVFEKEAVTLSKVNHHNLPKYYGRGEIALTSSTKLPVILREYFPSILLNVVLSGELLGTNKVITVIEDISSALDYLRDQGVVITDVDSGNIGIRADGSHSLMDVNLAKGDDGNDIWISERYTPPKELIGSPKGQVFGLGLIAYELFGGELPSREEIAMGQVKLNKIPGVSDNVLGVLEKALSGNDKDLSLTPGEFAKTLKSASEASL